MDEIRRNFQINAPYFDINERIIYIKENILEVLNTHFPEILGNPELDLNDMITKILAYFIYVGVENPLRRQTAGVERF